VHYRPEPQLVTTDAGERVMAYLVFITNWAERALTFAASTSRMRRAGLCSSATIAKPWKIPLGSASRG
jgi:hypothetical protein